MIALLLLALAPALAAQDGGSLEDLRARLAKELAASTSTIAPQVDAALLEAVTARKDGSPRRTAAAREELAALPSTAALVLVERLPVTNDKTDEDVWRAQEAGRALRTVASAATLGRLVELTRHTSPTTRRLALAALGSLPNTESAAAALTARLEELRGAERAEAVGALVHLGGAPAAAVFLDAVEGRDIDALRAAIAAATSRGDASHTALVDRIAADSDLARGTWRELLDHLAALPALLEPQRVNPLLGLVLAGSVKGDDASVLVERVGLLPIARRHVQDALEAISRMSDVRAATSAKVALARLGDRNVEKALIDDLDAKVEAAQSGDAKPLRDLGQMRILLGDYNGAINDLKKALKEAKDGGAFVQREIHIDIARAYALNERLDKAAAALVDANLTNARREEVAALPEFAALGAHPRYGEVLDRE
jgi:hypothetical protein